MRRIGTGLAAVAAVSALVLAGQGTAGAQQAEGTLTFRGYDGTVIEQHVNPKGCYNVPDQPGLAQAELPGPASLIDGPDCEGPEAGDLGPAPAPVYPGQSVLVPFEK